MSVKVRYKEGGEVIYLAKASVVDENFLTIFRENDAPIKIYLRDIISVVMEEAR